VIRAHTEAHIHHHALGELARRYAQHPDHHRSPFRSGRAMERMLRCALLPYTSIGRAQNAHCFRLRLPGDPFIVRRPREDEKG
jgi:hypothetical protein